MGRDEKKGGCGLSFRLEHAVLLLVLQLPLAIRGSAELSVKGTPGEELYPDIFALLIPEANHCTRMILLAPHTLTRKTRTSV